mgnify:CR=1 FL=1
MNIRIKSLHIENFKGIKEKDITFSDKLAIRGANATGKTTIFDAVTWLLFNKNSLGSEKFEIRPLDADGKQIDFVEIFVSAVFDKDGEEFSLEKRQKQKWVKHTGDETATFSGNVNEYSVNGYPKAEKEFKAYIAELIPEDLFKLLSNPTFFTSLEWKKQREILMKFASTESDLEIAKRVGGFDKLIPELEKAPTTSDITAKWSKTKKELDAKQRELPVRIDEISKQKVDYDLAELELQKADLERQLTAPTDTNEAELKALQTEYMDNEFKMSSIATRANAEVSKARTEVDSEIYNIQAEIHKSERAISVHESNKNYITADNNNKTALMDKYSKKYFDTEALKFPSEQWVFDEKSTVCSLCGQKLPQTKIDELRSTFELKKLNAERAFMDDRKNEMERLVKLGNDLKNEIKVAESRIADCDKGIEEEKAKIEKNKATVEKLEKKLAKLPTEADLSKNAEYNSLVNRNIEIDKRVTELTSTKAEPVDLAPIKAELDAVNRKIAEMYANDGIDERIAELKEEQKTVSQKIADCESILYLLGEFIKKKLDIISESINKHFTIANFKLFNVLNNGGVEECCELTVNGVPYNSLNNGMRICGGIDVINTLAEVYGTSVFVFIDNAESVNDYNIPETKGQLIKLIVTDDKEMAVTE